MGAQQATIGEVERVVHRARGMVRREIERLEIVPVVLDLGTVSDFGNRAARENIDHAFERARQRMQSCLAREFLPGRVISSCSDARRRSSATCSSAPRRASDDRVVEALLEHD